MLRKLVIVLCLLFSSVVSGTADIEQAEDVLGMVRLFLSNPFVSADVNAHAKNGCVWISELIWAGSGTTNGKNQTEYSGGFTFYFRTMSGLKKELRYSYSVVVTGEIKYLSRVEYASKQKISPECSD